MKISSKGRYAVRIMAELAKHDGQFVSVSELSEKQGITVKYLEKIISLLSKSKLIQSSRGQKGGYKLAGDAKDYTVAQILQATGDLSCLAPCLAKNPNCPRIKNCDSINCWEKLSFLINDYLSSVTLDDLLKKKN